MSTPLPIIRSSRRKTLAIQVERDGRITVRAPEKLPDRLIATFVKEQEAWIQKHLKNRKPAPERTFSHGETFLFLGREIPLKLVPSGRQSLWLDDIFKLTTRNQNRAKDLFISWYKREARSHLRERVATHAELMNLEHGSLRISNARYTWGSCSPTNRLSFTWRLVMAPEDVIDYVVVHELSHVVHKNHGKRFWQKVAKFCPEYKKHRAWLDSNGHQLTL